MIDAILLWENDSRYCPVTNLYRCADGRHLLVTYPRLDVLGTIAGLPGMAETLEAVGIQVGPHSQHQAEQLCTEVFLADENGCVVDADGDPANGMTALLRCASAVPIHEALAQLGYREVRPTVEEEPR